MIKKLKDDLKSCGFDLVAHPGKLDKLKSEEIGFTEDERCINLHVPLAVYKHIFNFLEIKGYRPNHVTTEIICPSDNTTELFSKYISIDKNT